jgi:hypothetical protein
MLMFSGLGASAAVTTMQKALAGLAQAACKPEINPGEPSGTVDAATLGAVAAMLAWGAKKIPQDETAKYLSKTLNVSGIAAGFLASSVGPVVAGYATWITRTANALTVAVKQGVIKGACTTPDGGGGGGGGGDKAAPAWYQTPEGMVGILLAAVVGYKFLLAPKA